MSIFKQKSFDEEFEDNNINNIDGKSENKIIELNEKLDTITEKIGNLLWRKHKQEQQKQKNTSIYFDSLDETSQVSSIFTDDDRFDLERLSYESDRLEGAINLEYSLFRLNEDRLQD